MAYEFGYTYDRFDRPEDRLREQFGSTDRETAQAMLRDPADPTLHEFLSVTEGSDVEFDYDPDHDISGWREGNIVGPNGDMQRFHLRAEYPGRVAQTLARIIGKFGGEYEPATTVYRRVYPKA